MAMKTDETVDVLAIGAHPDDVEIGCGGTVAMLARWGRRVAILDMTQGEMGTRGAPDERAAEARKAGLILGLTHRCCANLPDDRLRNTPEQREALIPFLRRFRPRIILTLMAPDRHPDHAAGHELVRDANYLAGLARIETGQPPHRARQLFYFHPYADDAGEPSFLIDVSPVFDIKLEALRAHASQFFNPSYPGEETYISSKPFWDGIETRARYWGNRMGVPHAEAFHADGPLGLYGLPGMGG